MSNKYSPTIGVEYATKLIPLTCAEGHVKAQIWDTGKIKFHNF